MLDEAGSACREAPIRPSLGQRFALMFLFAVGDGDRQAYDDFWRTVQDRYKSAYSESMGHAMRETNARTFLTASARNAGVDFSAEYQSELCVARMSPDERQAYREDEARLAEHRRRLRDDDWQYETDDRVDADERAVAAGECVLPET